MKYWRDIGTLDAYWEANMDLVDVDPLFNLYDEAWPIRTYQGQFPPAKFVFAQDYQGGRMGWRSTPSSAAAASSRVGACRIPCSPRMCVCMTMPTCGNPSSWKTS
ncbi:MAG: hypothetical protein U0361_23215 [Nitrospiraceae bacterium]